MNESRPSNESASGTTSTIAPVARGTSEPEVPAEPNGKKPASLSEADFLAKQAADASAAMRNAWADLKRTLVHSADVRAWAQKYPWLTTGAAVAVGVVAGYALTPRDRDEVREMWESFKDKLAGVKEEAAKEPAPPRPSMLSTLMREAIKVAGPLLTTLVAAHGQAQAAEDPGSTSKQSSEQHAER